LRECRRSSSAQTPLGDFEAFPAKFDLGSKARSRSGG
jgi:hypothetical protein